jgi:hypothetical protein
MQLNHVTNSNTCISCPRTTSCPIHHMQANLRAEQCYILHRSTERLLWNGCVKNVKLKAAVRHTLHWVPAEWRTAQHWHTYRDIYTSTTETNSTYLSINLLDKSHDDIKQLHERLTVSASLNDCSVSHSGARLLPVAPNDCSDSHSDASCQWRAS